MLCQLQTHSFFIIFVADFDLVVHISAQHYQNNTKGRYFKKNITASIFSVVYMNSKYSLKFYLLTS